MKEGFYPLPPNPDGGFLHIHENSDFDARLLENNETHLTIGENVYKITGSGSQDLRSEEHVGENVVSAWNYPAIKIVE